MICVCGTKLCKLKMVSDILDHPVYGMFLCKNGILTKNGTYLSLKLNLVIFVNLREKIEKCFKHFIRKSI